MDWQKKLQDYKDYLQMQPQQHSWAGQGTYLNSGGLNPDEGKGSWEDLVRQLGFSNLENMTDFQSPLYQQYAQYLQKTQGGIGVNSLLAPLMAGGTGYAGGQGIAQHQAQGMNRERQDKINTGVQEFAIGNQRNVLAQLGQIGNSFQNTLNRQAMQEQADAANSPWNALGSALGTGLGLLNPFNFGSGSASKMSASPVGGY